MRSRIVILIELQILLISIILFLTYSFSLATGGGSEDCTIQGSQQTGNCTVNNRCECSGTRVLTITHNPGTCPSGKSCNPTATRNGILTITETCSERCTNSEGSCTEGLCTVGAPLTSTSGPYQIYSCQ